mmetsp:Transcript_10447/g.23163  ORF Transcript_10447/g.23163 Transcript_10447/m.23163 type:complete len:212 (-) Transcript_10447:80-715(-)
MDSWGESRRCGDSAWARTGDLGAFEELAPFAFPAPFARAAFGFVPCSPVAPLLLPLPLPVPFPPAPASATASTPQPERPPSVLSNPGSRPALPSPRAKSIPMPMPMPRESWNRLPPNREFSPDPWLRLSSISVSRISLISLSLACMCTCPSSCIVSCPAPWCLSPSDTSLARASPASPPPAWPQLDSAQSQERPSRGIRLRSSPPNPASNA